MTSLPDVFLQMVSEIKTTSRFWQLATHAEADDIDVLGAVGDSELEAAISDPAWWRGIMQTPAAEQRLRISLSERFQQPHVVDGLIVDHANWQFAVDLQPRVNRNSSLLSLMKVQKALSIASASMSKPTAPRCPPKRTRWLAHVQACD